METMKKEKNYKQTQNSTSLPQDPESEANPFTKFCTVGDVTEDYPTRGC